MTRGSSLEGYPLLEPPDLPVSGASEPEPTEEDEGTGGAKLPSKLTVNDVSSSCEEGRDPYSDWVCWLDEHDE